MRSIITALSWAWLMASSFVISAFITPYASPLATTGLRFIIALAVMTPAYYLYLNRRSDKGTDSLLTVLKSPKQTLQYLIISGSLVGFFIALFTALQTTTSLNTSVMYTFVPLLGALILLCFKQYSSTKQWLGFVLGSMGAVSVLLFTREGELVWHVGDKIYLLGCILLALHVVGAQRWGGHVNAYEGAFRILFFGALWLIPITLIWGDLANVAWHSMSFWKWLLYLTCFTTLLTFVLQQQVIRFSGASRLLAFSYTIPIWVAFYQASQSSLLLLASYGFIIGSFLVVLALVMIDSRLSLKME